MGKFVFKDYIPANARVIAEYDKDIKVLFSYPIEWSYQKAVWKRAYPTIINFWIYLHLIPTIYLLIFILLPFLTICLIAFPTTIYHEAYTDYLDYKVLMYFIVPISYFCGIPAIATLILSFNKEKMSELLPKIGYWTAKMSLCICKKVFTKDDIIKNKCIIPSFSNVYLYYKTSKDFNKYLKKIEILEIPFEYEKRSFWNPFKLKTEKNDYDFRTVFYFTKKPQNGELIVEFC